MLEYYINRNPSIKESIGPYTPLFEQKSIYNYASAIEKSYGEKFVCIGNAGTFIDPVFSSGATIALKSAQLASKGIIKDLKGEPFNWDKDYYQPLHFGIQTFSNFVEAWYEETLQHIIFDKIHGGRIRKLVISILAGYAWDKENPYTKNTLKRLRVLSKTISEK